MRSEKTGSLSEEEIRIFKEENKKIIFRPLKVFAIIIAAISIALLIFGFISASQFILDTGIARLTAAIAALISLISINTALGKEKPHIFVHLMIWALILTTGYIIYRAPESFVFNSYYVIFIIFMFSLFLGWESIHQIILVSLFLAVIILSVVLNGDTSKIFNEDIVHLVSFLLIGIGSIVANKIIYESKRKAAFLIGELLSEPSVSRNEISAKTSPVQDVNQFVIPFFVTNREDKIIEANVEFIKLLGYSSKSDLEKLSLSSDIFANPGDRNELLLQLDKKNTVKNYNLLLKRKSGQEFVVRFYGRKIKNDEKKDALYEGTIEEITDEVKEQEKLYKELEDLRKEQQRAANEATNARYTSNIKTRFLANMSHEIRTPMNSVLGFLTLIENGLFESMDELKDFASNAKVSAESLLDIINNILDISKIEAGKMDLLEEEFNIRDEVDKARSICTPAAKEKTQKITYSIADDVPAPVIGDATRYRQILVNLLGNAVKFTGEDGTISIRVELLKRTEATATIKTIVKDSGKGIPKDKIPELFKAYSQLKEGKIAKQQGSGLGLMICKEFVSLMGGDIYIDSELNKGTDVTFTVILSCQKNFLTANELKTEEIPEIQKESATANAENFDEINEDAIRNEFEIDNIRKLPRTIHSKTRLLLVEDNPISQKVELKLLREVGYSVDAVSNGFDAIEAVKTNSFNLVLMDIEMTDLDGIAATKKIRELDSQSKNIPIIAVTAHSSMKDREKCLAAGMNDYIAKPININFLKMIIDKWLSETIRQ
ncbi:MAG: response regulator [Ignavibacteria bacterium]|nr:response regulator [Ignavibacteria bacterium]